MSAAEAGELRYLPYGENRFTSGTTPTTFDFTGQRVEVSLGLHYFQARWFDSQLGRFISADTIIPKTGGVLSWDRYLFVLGNPLKYTDPSGHEICMDDGNCEKKLTAQSVLRRYGVVFKGEWSNRDQLSVLRAVTTVGLRFGAELGTDSYSAFKEVYNVTHSDPFVFQYGGCKECNGAGGATYSARLVKFASLSSRSDLRRVNNVIHELGHAFNSALITPLGEDHMPYSVLDNYWDTHDWPRRSTPYTRNDNEYYGLAGPRNERVWHQNPTGSAGEEFADTFLAWATNSWDAKGGVLSDNAEIRSGFMNKYMPIWLGIARNW
jgi:RHS repeat-associated protein